MLTKAIGRFAFVLSVLAATAMVVLPAAPAFASVERPAAASNQLIYDHAVRGNVAVLSPEQMGALAVSNPKLHAKLVAAHQNGSVPKLTPAEKRTVKQLTAQNLDAIKAGWAWGWTVVAIVVGVWLFLCIVLNWGFPCIPLLARP